MRIKILTILTLLTKEKKKEAKRKENLLLPWLHLNISQLVLLKSFRYDRLLSKYFFK